MEVEVKLFAGLAERAGSRAIRIWLPEQATIADARSALKEKFGAAWPEAAVVALNTAYVEQTAVVKSGDVLAVIPPVSGG